MTTQLLAVILAVCLYRLRRPATRSRLRLRAMRGGDVVQGSLIGLITPLGKDTSARLRRRAAIARMKARRGNDPAHRDRRL